MAWKAETIMSQRHEFCSLAVEPGANISVLCQQFCISRTTGYKWLLRYEETGDSGLDSRSRRPRHSPNQVDPVIEAAVIDLRRQYAYWGPRKLHRLLRDRLPAQRPLPSVSTVARILQRNGLITPREEKVQFPTVGRFERSQPNELWQMDLKAPLRLPNRQKVYPVMLLDDYSRYLPGLWMIPDQTTYSVLNCWIAAACRYGLPQETLTDHGSQFRMVDDTSSAFRTYLWACDVVHIQGRVAHPQTQGKVERLNQTLNTEVLSRHTYSDVTSWQQCFDDWRFQYNTVRPHQELGDEPPIHRYRPSDRPFVEPDRDQCVGKPGSVHRRVHPRGIISIGGQRIMIGRGLTGWMVENRPLGNGFWHVFFRHHFIREYMLTPGKKIN